VDKVPLPHFKYPLDAGDLVDQPGQSLQDVRPSLIYQKQIDSEENDRDHNDDRRISNVLGRRKGRAVKFFTP
jgi:hypothetical protein